MQLSVNCDFPEKLPASLVDLRQGDVAILDLVEGPVTFVDTRNNKRDGKAYLKPVQTVINGVPFGRPYQAPFAVR